MKYLHLIWAALFQRQLRTIFTLLSVLAAFLLFGLLDSVRSAFLHAGASHVVATLWPVEDRATAALMERFYQAYAAGGDPAAALAAAQRAFIAGPATAHPFYWAGFLAVGGGR